MKRISLLVGVVIVFACLGMLHPQLWAQYSPVACHELLRLAAKEGDLKAVNFCLREGVVDEVDKDDALWYAAEKGYADIVKVLIANGADVKAKDENGITVLMWAAGNNHIETVKVLIANGADVNAKDNYGETVLMWAASNIHIEIVKVLIANGADVNAKDNYGGTVLMWAARYGANEVVQILIAHGADVNAEDKYGNTALTWAARDDANEVVKTLIANGADVNAALMLASEKGHTEIVEAIKKARNTNWEKKLQEDLWNVVKNQQNKPR